MGYKAITQIILTLVALVIIFVYIQPTLIGIRETQDELFQYASASKNASELNNKLAELVDVEKSFRSSDKDALNTYLPSTIDELAVMADITAMVEQSNARVESLTSGVLVLPADDALIDGKRVASDNTSYLDFNLEVKGSYEALKMFLVTLEQNKYPLEIIELSFGEFISPEIGVITQDKTPAGNYKFVLRTYAYSHVGN